MLRHLLRSTAIFCRNSKNQRLAIIFWAGTVLDKESDPQGNQFINP